MYLLKWQIMFFFSGRVLCYYVDDDDDGDGDGDGDDDDGDDDDG